MSWLTSSTVGRVALVVTETLARRWTLSRRVEALAARVETIEHALAGVREALDRIEARQASGGWRQVPELDELLESEDPEGLASENNRNRKR